MGTRITSLANNFDTTGKLKAAGINNASLSGITALPSGVAGYQTLIKTVSFSTDTTSVSFVNGTSDVVFDSTYDVYRFTFSQLEKQNNSFWFQCSTDGGSTYGVTATTTGFQSYHNEGDTGTGLVYEGSTDLAQGTGYITMNNDSDEATTDEPVCGDLWIYNPASTTYVKHFHSRVVAMHRSRYFVDMFSAGYFNTTSALNAIQMDAQTGDMTNGVIKMYGIKTS